MDYNFVDEILRECTLLLRERLNPSDTLPHMKLFTSGEIQKIKCELNNKGEGPANDELLNVVRTKPKTFIYLLVSLKKNHNDGLYSELWTHIVQYFERRNMPSQVDNLHQHVESILQSNFQSIQGASGEGTSNTGGGVDARLQLQQGLEESQSRNQSARGTTPRISLVNDSRSSSGISFSASGCASPDENNFEDKELDELPATVVEKLGKELEKLDTDGKAGWEHILRYLKQLKITMGERKSVSRAPNPGEKCLEFLGDKQITVGQLREALLMNNLQQANQILFGEIDTRLHASSSEGNISQLGQDSDRQKQNNAPFTSLQFNNLNTEDQRQKPGTGIKRIDSAQSSDRSVGTGITSEFLSPTDTSSSSSSVFPSGPNVTPVSSVSAPNTGELSLREITLSSINTQDSSLRSNEGASLKETRPITAVGDPEKEQAVLNADVEHVKLVYDRNLQADVIGNTANSFSYIDIQRPTPTENAPRNQIQQSAENILSDERHGSTENLGQEANLSQNQCASGLRDPDLGLGIPPAPGTDQFRQAAEHENVIHTLDDSGGDTSEIGVQSERSEQQDIETITTSLDNIVNLNTDSLQDSMVND